MMTQQQERAFIDAKIAELPDGELKDFHIKHERWRRNEMDVEIPKMKVWHEQMFGHPISQ